MLVAPKGFFEPEYSASRAVFADRGIDVAVATAGKSAVSAQGTTIRVDLDVADADAKDFDALFVVGGKGMIEFSDDKAAKRILRKFVRVGKPVAMICHAPLLAAKAKVAAGRQMTGWPEIRPDMVASGAKWTGMPVERDGDLFTAVGPEDAESLADILVRRMDGAPTLSEAMLDDNAAMRKLARLWRAAARLDKPMTDEEAERWLTEFERRDEGEEEPPSEPTTPKPVLAPAPKSVPALAAKPKPEPEFTPDPERRDQITHKPKNEWNIVVELRPPRTDGGWPELPETPPVGFPFPAEALKDSPSIRALFQKPETWRALKEIAANPNKSGTIQSYLVPTLVLVIGKAWWEINKRRKQLGNAPFGLFSSDEYKTIQDANVPMEETQIGRAFIALINWQVTKILQFYLATGKIENARLDGYIYDALNKHMVNDAGKRHGFEPKRQPACAYCRSKRVIETTPPFLSQIGTHTVQERNLTRSRPLFKCPTCEDLIETKEQELRLKEQGVRNAEESLRDIAKNVRNTKDNLTKDPDSAELKQRLVNYEAMLASYRPQVEELAKERNTLKGEIQNRRNMIGVPYSHLSCINEACPGAAIPLTFVDWDNSFWKTPAGDVARRDLASFYHIEKSPEGQKAEDAPQESVQPTSERAGKKPPPWMWHIPFRCPFDGLVFTPHEAFGKGRVGEDGTRLGGLFVNPPRATRWWKPMSLEQQRMPDDEGQKQRIEEIRSLTGIETTTDSPDFLRSQEMKQENAWLADRLREDILRQRENFMKERGTLEGHREVKLRRTMFDALLEWAYLHPIHLVAFYSARSQATQKPQTHVPVGTEPVVDGKSGEVKEHLDEKNIKMSPKQAERIISAIIQVWFEKMLAEKDGLTILKGRPGKGRSGKLTGQGNYLAIKEVDGVEPDGFFVTTVQRALDGQLEALCNLRTTSPKTRGAGYYPAPWMALVQGIWDYDGPAERMGISMPLVEGQKLVAGKRSHLHEMETHNSHGIRFDPETTLKEGDRIVVKALLMPRNSSWPPNKFVSHIRQGLKWDIGDAKVYYSALRRRQKPKPSDEQVMAFWTKKMQEANMTEKLEKFYETVYDRLRHKEDLSAFEIRLLEQFEQAKEQEASDTMVSEAKDPLAKYQGKREFDKTTEPKGKESEGGNRYRFVIQLHHAKKAGDHYDLRLENDEGALSSWSIPKHRLPKGKEKLLAVRTEDHPVEYLKFKGEIPAGEYGVGTMEIHDSGTYEEIEAGKTKIVFCLKGKKEKGAYKLFRAGEGNKWMVMEHTENKQEKKEAACGSSVTLFSKRIGSVPLSKMAAHSGAMLALMAPSAIARKMRKAKMVEDEDLSDTLHMTLLYLGKAADLSKETLEAVRKAAEKVCERHDPLKMGVSGAGTFTPEEDGTPVYVVPNAKGLSALQADLENVIGSIVDLPSEHGWVPHMTVCYCRDGKPELPDLTEKLEWTADKVRLQAGDEKIADIPIGRRKKGGSELPLSRRAALERLPIAADPVMWTDEQLVEAVRRPELFGNDKDRYRAAVEQLAKRGLVKKVEPTDIGEWRERGWWLLMWAGIPLAFYNNDAAASMAKRLLAEDFAKDGTQPIAARKFDPIHSRLRWQLDEVMDLGPAEDYEEADHRRGRAGTAVDELVTHPMYAKRRREFAEKALNIAKAPAGFRPFKESVPSGARPTETNADAAEARITDMRFGNTLPEFTGPLVDSQEAAKDAGDELVEDTAKRLAKRLEAERAGLDPEKLADDDALELALIEPDEVPLSKRTETYQ